MSEQNSLVHMRESRWKNNGYIYIILNLCFVRNSLSGIYTGTEHKDVQVK